MSKPFLTDFNVKLTNNSQIVLAFRHFPDKLDQDKSKILLKSVCIMVIRNLAEPIPYWIDFKNV